MLLQPDPQRSLLVATIVGVVEAASLLAYGVSVAAFEQLGETSGVGGSDLAPAVLTGLFAVFGVLVLLVAVMVRAGKARTPYVLVQAFALVVGQPLVLESSTRWIGVIVFVLALLGLGSILTSRERPA